MSIGVGWHARFWVIFTLAARCVAGHDTQNGCNANGPRVPCGEYDIKMLQLGVYYLLNVQRGYGMVLEGHAVLSLLHSLLLPYSPDVSHLSCQPHAVRCITYVQVHST